MQVNTTKCVILPDGYSGLHTIFNANPIKEDEHCVKLQCVEKGREYLTRWVHKDHFVNANKMVNIETFNEG